MMKTILVVFLVLTSLAFSQSDNYYFRLHPQWTRVVNSMIVMDANRDGLDEFFFRRGQQYDLMNYNVDTYYKSFKFFLPESHSIVPIPAARMDSIFFLVNIYHQDTTFVKILPPSDKMIGQSLVGEPLLDLWQFTRHAQTPPPDFRQSFSFLNRFNSRGQPLYLFHTNSPWDVHGERAIFAMDYKNQKLYWKFSFGPYLTFHKILDIDGDGNSEILLSTYASNNGLTGETSKDDSSCVFLLDHQGSVIWQRTIGGYWTGAFADAGDIDGDSQLEIVCVQLTVREAEFDQDRVFILNAQSGEVLKSKRIGERFRVGSSIRSKICDDLNGDDRDEIVIGNSDGYLRVLDDKLNVLFQSRRYNGNVIMEGVEDLTGDGIPEIIATLRDQKLMVFDRQANELASYPLSPESGQFPALVKTDNKTFIVMRSSLEGEERATLLELQKSIFSFATPAELNAYSLYILILFPFLGLGLYLRYHWKSDQNLVENLRILPSPVTDGMLVVRKNGKIKYMGRKIPEYVPMLSWGSQDLLSALAADQADQWNSLKLLLKKESTSIKISLDGKNLEIHPIYFRRSKFIGLFFTDLSLNEHVNQVKLWARVAQRLAHGIKNPLTSVKLNAQELQYLLLHQHKIDDSEIVESLDAISSQVTKLKRMTDGFMRFVEFDSPVLKEVDINALLEGWVGEWSITHDRKIYLEWDLEKNLPGIKIDKEQFSFAFRNIYFNAVESIETEGSILISTSLVKVIEDTDSIAEYIEIQVQDTGKGIPPEYIDKIKQPYFTLKPEGTGLGLAIVDKIMASHQGTFTIDSQPGSGTTVTLRVPL